MKNRTSILALSSPSFTYGFLWALNMCLIPSIVSNFTKDQTSAILLISMGALTGIFVQYFSGILSDRIRSKNGKRRPVMIISLLLAITFLILIPSATSYSSLFIYCLFFYIFLNSYQAPAVAVLLENVSEDVIGYANGVSRLITVIGSLIAFVLWNLQLNTMKLDLFTLCIIFSIISVLPFFLCYRFIKEKSSLGLISTKVDFEIIKDSFSLKFFIASFFIYLGYGCVTPFFTDYCMKALNLSSAQASTTSTIALAVLSLAGALLAIPCGKLCDKKDRKNILLWSVILMAISMAASIFATIPIVLYITMAIMGIAYVTINIVSYSIIAVFAPSDRLCEYIGLYNMFISLPQFLTNNLMGSILISAGYNLLFPISTAVVIIAILILKTIRMDIL